MSNRNVRLPPEVNRIIYVKNLPFKIGSKDLYEIFGKFGSIRQIRKGTLPKNRGTAFVVYDDIFDAKAAVDGLSGFHVMGRYLVTLYFHPEKMHKKMDQAKKRKELDELKKKYNVNINPDDI
eukprot:TRINITY_DN4074_c0_g1_i1.p1 TRINITY_DN4074_c0_g1~~TRINITY_DN4074_c0_g1_i1.p1  ORF type:complete len:122 (+),score=21.76 TRINITY_DN4074_c0_g1_i1:39-404(+)